MRMPVTGGSSALAESVLPQHRCPNAQIRRAVIRPVLPVMLITQSSRGLETVAGSMRAWRVPRAIGESGLAEVTVASSTASVTQTLTGGTPTFGALVISLDFELHWGMRDHQGPQGPYRKNLEGVWAAIPALLNLFAEFEVRATWATVGFLFARDGDELHQFAPPPHLRPPYERSELSAYDERMGSNEVDDPIHFAPSLVRLIADAPGQEVGSHTFSHYYCLERGQTAATFEADVRSAIAIAGQHGIALRSIVLPRNQVNPSYRSVLRACGLTRYRGNQAGQAHRATDQSRQSGAMRLRRLTEAYLGSPATGLVKWTSVREEDGLYNVAGSCFLRPHSRRLAALEPVRLQRINSALDDAARSGRIFHLWWHPHNFGINLDQNIAFLRRVLEKFAVLRDAEGMRSMTMNDVADATDGSWPGNPLESLGIGSTAAPE